MDKKRRINWTALIFGVVLFGFTAFVLFDTFLIPHVYTVVDEPTGSKMIVTFAPRSTPTSEPTAEPTEPPSTEAVDTPGSDTAAATTSAVTDTPAPTPTPTPTPTPKVTEAPTPTPKPVDNVPVLDLVPLREPTEDEKYEDDYISITIETYRYFNSDIHVARVKILSIDLLKSGFAKHAYGKNVNLTVADIAKDYNAILAINGDFYGARGGGFVIRNGVQYRAENWRRTDAPYQDLVVYNDGTFEVINEYNYTGKQLIDAGALQVYCFGPGLLQDGKVMDHILTDSQYKKDTNPRTAIGIVDVGEYIFFVNDGRSETNLGVTIYQLAQLMKSLGCKTAYNLDGGGSSTMVFKGKLINAPSTYGQISERKVSDIVYIGY